MNIRIAYLIVKHDSTIPMLVRQSMISKKVIIILGVVFVFASIGVLLVMGLIMSEIYKASHNPKEMMAITQNHPFTVKFLEKHPTAVGGMSSSCSMGECNSTVQYQTQTFEIFRVESLKFSFDDESRISEITLECIDTRNPVPPSLEIIVIQTIQNIEEFECI